MSPELETLDQLLGGELPIHVIRGLFADDKAFIRATLAMLEAGDIRLIRDDGSLVVPHEWENFVSAALEERSVGKFSITDQGARRIS